MAPGGNRVANAAKLQGSGKIIAAAMGDDEHRELQFDQLRQMTVHRAVPAQDQDRGYCAGACGQPNLPDRIRDCCKRLQLMGGRAQSKNGGDSHFAAEVNKL